eukprot:Lankesteria_metandrocarpae@DN7140_c0_g1_i1.p1
MDLARSCSGIEELGSREPAPLLSANAPTFNHEHYQITYHNSQHYGNYYNYHQQHPLYTNNSYPVNHSTPTGVEHMARVPVPCGSTGTAGAHHRGSSSQTTCGSILGQQNIKCDGGGSNSIVAVASYMEHQSISKKGGHNSRSTNYTYNDGVGRRAYINSNTGVVSDKHRLQQQQHWNNHQQQVTLYYHQNQQHVVPAATTADAASGCGSRYDDQHQQYSHLKMQIQYSALTP